MNPVRNSKIYNNIIHHVENPALDKEDGGCLTFNRIQKEKISNGVNRVILLIVLMIGFLTLSLDAQAEEKVFRLGIIGLDTSHVTAFTALINKAEKNYGCKVVAGYPGGSPDIKISASRVEKYTQELRDKYGVEIVDSIEELCRKVNGVLLESVDGRPHLEQVKPVIAAKKPVFIDKPMAGSLADVVEDTSLCLHLSDVRLFRVEITCRETACTNSNISSGVVFVVSSIGISR